MHFRPKISVLCIFVIVFQIAQCRTITKETKEKTKNVKVKSKTVDKNMFKGLPEPPKGYHYETMSQIMKTYKPDSFKIMTMKEAAKIQAIKKQQKEVKKQSQDSGKQGQVQVIDVHDTDDHGDEDTDNDNNKDNDDDDNDNYNNGDDNDKDDNDDDKNDNDDNKNDNDDDKNDNEDDKNDNDDDKNDNDDDKNDNDDDKNDNDDNGDNHGNDGDDHGNDEDDHGNDEDDHGNDEDDHGHDKDDHGHDEDGHDKDDHDHDKDDHDHDEDGHDNTKDDHDDGNDNYNNGDDDEDDHDNDDHGHKDDKDHDDYDPADTLDGGAIENLEESAKESGHEKKRRKKRDFSFKLPFISSDNGKGKTETDTVVTDKAITTTATTVTDSSEVTTVTDTTATATAVTTGGKSDSSGGASDADVQTVTAVTTVTTNSSAGFMDGIQSGMMRIASIGQDVKTSLVVAAPYLPMVWKVASFVIPGLSQYEILMLTVNVATVTAQALQNYDSGQSLMSVLTDVAKKALWKSILSKRDGGFSLGDYTSNVYKTVKTHFGYIPKYFSGGNSVSSVIVTLGQTTNGVDTIPGAEITVPENEEKPLESINKSDKMTEDLKKKIMDMKNRVHHSDEGSISTSDVDDDVDDDADDDADDDSEDKSNIKAENVEVNTTLFNQTLESSMKLQPEFIQKMSGEELVEYLNNLNLPSIVDSKPVFDVLTNKIGLDDRITTEQKNNLVNILSKITDYFISKGLEAKQYINSVID